MAVVIYDSIVEIINDSIAKAVGEAAAETTQSVGGVVDGAVADARVHSEGRCDSVGDVLRG